MTNNNTDNFGNVIPAGWELDPVWGNINGAIRPILSLIGKGAPKPKPSSPLWNDWAANNPTPQAIALANLEVNNSLMMSMKGICQGARPIELWLLQPYLSAFFFWWWCVRFQNRCNYWKWMNQQNRACPSLLFFKTAEREPLRFGQNRKGVGKNALKKNIQQSVCLLLCCVRLQTLPKPWKR